MKISSLLPGTEWLEKLGLGKFYNGGAYPETECERSELKMITVETGWRGGTPILDQTGCAAQQSVLLR